MSKAVPAGFHTITPHLVVKDCLQAIEFYKKAFGATVSRLHLMPDQKTVMHADLKIGDSIFMLNDEFPGGAISPLSPGGGSASCSLHIFTEDVDALWKRAVEAGAQVKMPLADQFWGDRYGALGDPYGHNWTMAAHIADPTEQEIADKMKQAYGGG